MLHLDLHVGKRLKVTGVTSLSYPRKGLTRNIKGSNAKTVTPLKLAQIIEHTSSFL